MGYLHRCVLNEQECVLPVWLKSDPSALVQVRLGVGYPLASQRNSTLLPSADVIFVAEVSTDGFTHWSSSARWNRTPARFSGPLHARKASIRTMGVSAILESSISLETLQSQYQGLSWSPKRGRDFIHISEHDWKIWHMSCHLMMYNQIHFYAVLKCLFSFFVAQCILREFFCTFWHWNPKASHSVHNPM